MLGTSIEYGQNGREYFLRGLLDKARDLCDRGKYCFLDIVGVTFLNYRTIICFSNSLSKPNF